MIAALLITFREVIEATLIVATMVGILTKLRQHTLLKTVWTATISAILASIAFLGIGTYLGFQVQELYSGEIEDLIEGILMIISASFVTWAVFFLHNTFGKYKVELLEKINDTANLGEKNAVFILVFTAIFREGIEIVLFLSTLYFATNPSQIFLGFVVGTILALAICFLILKTTISFPVRYAFKISSWLLVLFAAGLLARGIHELAEVGVIPELTKITIPLIPDASTFIGSTTKIVFGITQTMDYTQIAVYAGYMLFMAWWLNKSDASIQTKQNFD